MRARFIIMIIISRIFDGYNTLLLLYYYHVSRTHVLLKLKTNRNQSRTRNGH